MPDFTLTEEIVLKNHLELYLACNRQPRTVEVRPHYSYILFLVSGHLVGDIAHSAATFLGLRLCNQIIVENRTALVMVR